MKNKPFISFIIVTVTIFVISSSSCKDHSIIKARNTEISSVQFVDEDKTSSFKTEDILNVWREQEKKLKDFYVDFDMEQTIKDEKGTVKSYKHDNITYMAKDNLFRTRMQCFDPKVNDKISNDWEFSADGKREYYCDRTALYGTIKDTLPEQAGIQHSWVVHYLNCVQRMPRKKGNMGHECNLIGALEEDKRITATEELFDGRKVVVLNRPEHSKIYLDPKLNFAVIAGESTGGHITFKYKNSNFVEVADGIWLPMETERTFENKGDWITRKVKVNKLKVNNNYSIEDFRIDFEPQIRVRDVNRKIYIPSFKTNEVNQTTALQPEKK